MKDIRISASELINKNRFALPQKASDFANYSFWYYTSLHTANLILKDKSIYVSNILKMNDLDEIDMHKEDKELVHCLCFCNSNTEKIPMWYLYSGITGKGVSFGITPATMIKLLSTITTIETVDGKKTLKKGEDFDLEYGWIYYRKKDSPSKILYKRQWYLIEDNNDDIFKRNNFFIKSYPWEYEKEFRIVFHNKTGIAYEQLVVNISEIYDKLKIKLAPEISSEEFIDLLPTLDGFQNFFSHIPLHSDLGINMNLCKRNIDSFIDYIASESKKEKNAQDIDLKRICNALGKNCAYKQSCDC